MIIKNFREILEKEIKMDINKKLTDVERKNIVDKIYKKTHKDYRGSNGKSIMPPFSVYNMTTIVNLEKIPDNELIKIYNAQFRLK